MKKIKLVILGTDLNAYGVARSAHKLYGIKSICMGIKPLRDTRYSKICDVYTNENFENDDIFVEELLKIKNMYQDYDLILISCSDGYTSLVVNNKEKLKDYYLINYVDKFIQEKLENKIDFYNICNKYGLDYPDTVITNDSTNESVNKIESKLSYPIALKANDSIEYYNTHFEGKKKAYKIHDNSELVKTLNQIYKSGYTGKMIAQDFIPGDSSEMYVLNAYVDSNSKVKMMSLGKCLLDEVLPLNIGNYNAIVTMGDEKIYQQYKKFLEEISYTGFANFDLKYDVRDGKYKVFEINIRQGRSSFYMNATNNNFVKYLVDDLVYKKDEPCYYEYENGLWLYVDPSVLKKYVNEKDKDLAYKMLNKGYVFTTWYENDKNFKRYLAYMKRRISTIKYYKKYFNEEAM